MDVMNRCTYRVIYGDTDQMGVVYYANYFRFFERGRCELMRQVGLNYAEVERDGVVIPVTEATCRYIRSARFDDLLTIETRLAALGRVRFTFDYRILRGSSEGEELLATGRTEHACMSREGRPLRVPPQVRSLLGGASA